MQKLKSKRGAAKRFKGTANKKIKHHKAFGSHILSSKTTKRKRKLRKSVVVSKSDLKNIRKLLPYL